MSYTVKIEGEAGVLFDSMNRHLLESYKSKKDSPNMGRHRKNFEAYYGVEVVVENSHWAALRFPSEQHYMTMIMKYFG